MTLDDRLREEYEALGLMSYTGGQPDMTLDDIEQIRALIYETGQRLYAFQQDVLREITKSHPSKQRLREALDRARK